jgi:methanogenic corrinoid protein MtbC1
VPVATLRAWESRYGLLSPDRTGGGHRRYSQDDVARVLAVVGLVERGWAPGTAAGEVRRRPAPVTRLRALDGGRSERQSGDVEAASAVAPVARALAERLELAVRAFDEAAAEEVLDDAFARLAVATVLELVIAPMLRSIGEGWEDDPRLIALEHFATAALRPRLHRLLRGARREGAPTCLAAAPEGEDHELGVLAAAAVAADAGFRVTHLGARTPSRAIERSVEEDPVDVVLVGAATRGAAERFLADPPRTAGARLVLGGAGFREADLARLPGALFAPALGALPATLARALEPDHGVG